MEIFLRFIIKRSQRHLLMRTLKDFITSINLDWNAYKALTSNFFPQAPSVGINHNFRFICSLSYLPICCWDSGETVSPPCGWAENFQAYRDWDSYPDPIHGDSASICTWMPRALLTFQRFWWCSRWTFWSP